MVRVWYEPPPFGPGTDLNRSGYGVSGGGLFRNFLERVSRMNQPMLMTGVVAASLVIAYIPLIGHELPFTFDPEYQAASRAYMRYHNMNPIFGISSKQARAADPDP